MYTVEVNNEIQLRCFKFNEAVDKAMELKAKGKEATVREDGKYIVNSKYIHKYSED